MSGWETSHARSLITEKIESFGGRIVQHHDTGVDGAFGLEPTEDASARAAYAALAIRRMIERAGALPGDVALKLAIETLTCVVLEGVDRRTSLASESLRAATHGLTGLLETTELGSIAVGPGAVSHLARQFTLAPPVEDRHRGVTLLARRDGAPPGRRLPMRRWRTPFVGRTQELAFLEERLRQVAATGRGHVVGLMGEPGIGKSRLLDEFHRTLIVRGAVVLEGRCNAHVRSPYAAVTDLLRRAWLLDSADDAPSVPERVRTALLQLGLEPPMLSPYLHPLLGVASGSEATPNSGQVRANTYEALEQVLRAYAKSGPLVVLLEDIHWMDRLSEAFVASFVETLPGVTCLMVLTTRPGHRATWLDRSWASQLALPPLALPESRVIAQAVLPPASDVAIVEQIVARGEGNPFFLEELAGAVEGHTGTDGATGVPATVTAALEARMDRLRSDACRVLESAAVIGREVSARLLAAVTNQSTSMLAASLRELVAAEFLYERQGGLYVFKHALTQAVAYDRLAPPERTRLHAAVGQAVEQLHAGASDAVVAELAHHAIGAENWERAHRYLRATAMQASRASAFLEAAQLLEQALEALQKLSPSTERSRQQFDTMLELWTAYFESSQYARIPPLERALEPLGQELGQQSQLAGLLVRRAQFLWGQARPREVIATVAEVLRYAAPGDVRTRGYAHFLAGSASRDAGSFDDAFAAFATGAQLVGGLDLEHPDAPVILPILATIHAWRSEAYAVLGHHDKARNAAEEAVTLAKSLANDSGLVFGKAFLGYALVLHGDIDAALPLLEEAFSHFPPGQFVNATFFAAAFLAYALALAGQHARAISLLEQYLPLPPSATGRVQTTRYRSATAAAYLAAHRPDRALQELNVVLPIARAADARGHLPTLLRLRGEALLHTGSGELAEIRVLLLEARDIASSIGLEPESARCLAVLGRIDICAGMVASGRELLRRARVALENLGMHFWVRRVEMEIDNA
jgi:tetratricopeptide (TPR) repeat protein